MGRIKYVIALILARLAIIVLKLIRRDASYFPGKIAVTICPDFLGRIGKPEIIIGVTGTNGKTTVCNMINDILIENGYDVINNRLGSNVNSGIATTFISGATITGKSKHKIAVLEIDERSAKKIYPYVKPNFLVCTNLFRDSMKRNAHTEFIYNILTENIPKETMLILNGDDLISANLAPENKRVYFGIDRLDTDTEESHNIVKDIICCPKCNTELKYDYYRYNHIGKAHCPNCEFGTPEIDYLATKLDFEEKKLIINEKGQVQEYKMISDNIINIYNMIAVVTVLREFGISSAILKNSFERMKIVETRFEEETINNIKIIMQLAKGQNPIACSRAFEYVSKIKGNKVVIILLDDLHDATNSSECIAWLYDTDYEFLNNDSIKQIIVGGVRCIDEKIRLELAGIEENKIYCSKDEIEAVKQIELEKIDSVCILYDLYSMKLKEKIKKQVENIIEGNENSNE